jgi:hypothetical protein
LRVISIEMPSQGEDRAAKAHAALLRKFDQQADGDRELAKRLLSEHYRQMQRRSVRARQRKRSRRIAETAAALGLTTTEDELLALARAQRKR